MYFFSWDDVAHIQLVQIQTVEFSHATVLPQQCPTFLIRAAKTMRGFFGNCAMRDAGNLGKIVRQNPQNLPNMRCCAGLCGWKNYQYKKWIQLKSLVQYRNISCLIVSDLGDALTRPCCNRWRYVQYMKKTPPKIYTFFRFLTKQAGLPRIHPRNPQLTAPLYEDLRE